MHTIPNRNEIVHHADWPSYVGSKQRLPTNRISARRKMRAHTAGYWYLSGIGDQLAMAPAGLQPPRDSSIA